MEAYDGHVQEEIVGQTSLHLSLALLYMRSFMHNLLSMT